MFVILSLTRHQISLLFTAKQTFSKLRYTSMVPVEYWCKLNNYRVLTLAESSLKYQNVESHPERNNYFNFILM